MSVGRLRVLIAPDSFKGSLSSVDVSRSLAEGWARARPEDELILAPLADGGEGTLAAIAESGGWHWRECRAHDPLGRPLMARWLLSIDGTRAAVELAEASGLSRLPRDEPRNPVAATTEGTGEIEIVRRILNSTSPGAEVSIDEYVTACYGTTEYPEDLTGVRLTLTGGSGTQSIDYAYECREVDVDEEILENVQRG